MDPYVCCLLGICCPPFSAEQFEKLVALRTKEDGRLTRAVVESQVRRDLELVKRIKDSFRAVLTA